MQVTDKVAADNNNRKEVQEAEKKFVEEIIKLQVRRMRQNTCFFPLCSQSHLSKAHIQAWVCCRCCANTDQHQ